MKRSYESCSAKRKKRAESKRIADALPKFTSLFTPRANPRHAQAPLLRNMKRCLWKLKQRKMKIIWCEKTTREKTDETQCVEAFEKTTMPAPYPAEEPCVLGCVVSNADASGAGQRGHGQSRGYTSVGYGHGHAGEVLAVDVEQQGHRAQRQQRGEGGHHDAVTEGHGPVIQQNHEHWAYQALGFNARRWFH
ncbi:uncharacterized protein LOC143525828 [Brachyhypopomus gauderio]|uniref:uncharacterized protein LOC143525828 n=1 Tax=Brachyhypopomus gauderio TaxID=698409 RepID=UPI004042B0E5